jgi:hypothetical protein
VHAEMKAERCEFLIAFNCSASYKYPTGIVGVHQVLQHPHLRLSDTPRKMQNARSSLRSCIRLGACNLITNTFPAVSEEEKMYAETLYSRVCAPRLEKN